MGKAPELVKVNENETKCSLCGCRFIATLANEKGQRRTKAQQQIDHERLFAAHVIKNHSRPSAS
jgi:hypothetical protein